MRSCSTDMKNSTQLARDRQERLAMLYKRQINLLHFGDRGVYIRLDKLKMALSLCKRSKSFSSQQRKDEKKIFVFDTDYRVNGRSKRRNKVALDFF